MSSEWIALALAEAGTRIKALEAERDAFKARLDICHRDIEVLMSSSDKLEAENGALMTALKPFAEALGDPFNSWEDQVCVDSYGQIRVGDLRRARATLAETRHEHPGTRF